MSGIDPSKMTKAQLIAALQLLGAETKEAPKPEAVPFLSCWNASRVSLGKDRTFTHTSKKGGAKRYQALTADEAHAMVDANIAAGRVYAVTVK